MSPQDVRIGPPALAGQFVEVPRARGVVAFAHGSGSSRLSPRNRQVAAVLHAHGLSTLLLDLLTPDEADDRRCVFDIGLLAQRLGLALDWLHSRPGLEAQRIGLFGASTGAAAALRAAAARPQEVSAVVSRGGRPDLAGDLLAGVRAPTLLIVGGDDTEVLALNSEALRSLRCDKRLEVVPGATHLFEEPGTLDAVARLAADWFVRHLGRSDA
jgi:putative phosphoribosyl transferase